jgi:hypothetical protein
MNAIKLSGRLLVGLSVASLLAGCAANAASAPASATPTPEVTPTAAITTPAPNPTAAPTATAPSPPPTTAVYDASTAVYVHIEEPECVTGQAGTKSTVNGVTQLRGWTRHCRYDGADPRFSGWSDIVLNVDCYSSFEEKSKCVLWGTERIPGPDGDWVGTYWGGQFSGSETGVRANFEVLEGTGAYEGWAYVLYMNMAALGGEEWVIDGIIYHGPPPPVPPLPSPASE